MNFIKKTVALIKIELTHVRKILIKKLQQTDLRFKVVDNKLI